MEVIKLFQDKETRKIHRAGSEYKGNRVDELQSKGFLFKPKKSSKKAEQKKGDK